MEVSRNGVNFVAEFEGCRLTAYKCPAGVWTIGYGHTAGVREISFRQKRQRRSYWKKTLQNMQQK